jgi:UDP-N-acetylglucosamine:LPS N-acetylglucosamine transferase
MNPAFKNIEELAVHFKPPVLLISTRVGKGVVSVGEAAAEKLNGFYRTCHCVIEDFLPSAAMNEDVVRYKFISSRFPGLLNIPYRFPFIYYRKYFREKYIKRTRLESLKAKIDELNIKTLICCSHRPAFWASCLKMNTGTPVQIWGLLSEFGRSLGWKYIFWDQMNGYLSPVPKNTFDFKFPADFKFFEINLPVKNEYSELKKTIGDKNKVLLVCGFWGQGPVIKIISELRKNIPALDIFAVCGENRNLFSRVKTIFADDKNVAVFGALDTIAPLMSQCAAIITKPGISTILEANASGRKMFLIKGMPVAEDNNARYAIKNYRAEWFSIEAFKKWQMTEVSN